MNDAENPQERIFVKNWRYIKCNNFSGSRVLEYWQFFVMRVYYGKWESVH